MADFNKFNSFVAALANKQHDFANDTFKIALTNVAPDPANTQLSDITQITAENGYVDGGNEINISSSTQTNGVYTAALDTDVDFTAAGGTFGPLRYAVCYNDTHPNNLLVSYYDRGDSLTVQDGETFRVVVGASLFTLS